MALKFDLTPQNMGYNSNLQQFMAFIYCLNLLQLRIFYQSLLLCESPILDCSIPRMLTHQWLKVNPVNIRKFPKKSHFWSNQKKATQTKKPG